MKSVVAIVIRAFDGSLADAEGLLAVERATFDESPYAPEQVRAMLAEGPQRAWLALAGDEVAGFVIGFVTTGLRGPCWEVDMLAVHPDWRGHRLATRLIRAAAPGASRVCRARAVVASDNPASAAAFRRAGFHSTERCTLLIYRPEEHNSAPMPAPDVAVRAAASPAEIAGWLAEPPPPEGAPGLTILLAEQARHLAGYAELLDVQTLLYRGTWIESLVASTRAVRSALIQAALARAIAAGLDEIGAMVPEADRALQQALRAAQFRSLGEFFWLRADLPLPGLAGEAGV
jgi:ribosomal protein S18 acetylase RimI-like enzyme